MTFKTALLAAAATLMVVAPATAQDATTQPAPAPVPAPEAQAQPAPSPEEAAIEAAAEQFQSRLEAMSVEINTAVQAAGDDPVQAQTNADAVVDRYAPEMNAFADQLDAFFDAQIASSTDENEKAGYAGAKARAGTEIRGLPTAIKAQVAQGIAAQSTAPSAPAENTPATPPTE